MSKQLTYIPKLDGLRAIAAILVVISHYMEELHCAKFSYGGNGVQIFFVISGFLITSILLAQKNKTHESVGKLLKNFIIKRALRLFPIYYILIITLFAISFFGGLWLCAKEDVWYYFTYTQNYLFFLKGFQSPLLNHTWSLAVEEQFYLLWPLLILLIPKKYELHFISIVLFSGILIKYLLVELYVGPGTIKGITFIHFDTLGAGALLGYFSYYKKEKILNFLEISSQWIFILCLFISATLTWIGFNDGLWLPLVLNIMSVCLVYICFSPKETILSPILNSSVLQNIGKISYGIYIYHKPVPFFFNFICSKMHMPIIENKFVLFVIYAVITYIISALSWKLIESPISNIKKRFDL